MAIESCRFFCGMENANVCDAVALCVLWLKSQTFACADCTKWKVRDEKSGRRDGVRFGGDAVVCYFNKDAGSRFLPSISLK